MASLDIIALYPSINRGDAIDTILELYDQDPNKTTDIPTQTMRELLGWATVSIFQQNDKIYKQRSGLSMGSPISCILANVYIHQTIEKHPHFDNENLIYYKRYVDDTFILWKSDKTSFENHVNQLNQISENIKFTQEFESNHSLNFLDLTITRHQNQDFTFNLYKKDYAVINPIHWKSIYPPKMKMAIFKGYIHRIINTTSLHPDIIKNITFAIMCFHLKGYPIQMLMDSTYQTTTKKGKLYIEWLQQDNTANINSDHLPREPNDTPHYTPTKQQPIYYHHQHHYEIHSTPNRTHYQNV